MTVLTMPSPDLDAIADRIRTVWRETRTHQATAWDGYVEVGSLLMEARSQFPADQDYGRWFDEQELGFGVKWASRLIRIAQDPARALALVESALATGDEPPGVDRMIRLLYPPPPRERIEEQDPLDSPIDGEGQPIVGYDEHGTPLGWNDRDTANHLYDFRIEVRVFGLKVPSEKTRTRGDREGQPRESVESDAIRQPISLPFTVAVREAGWPGLISAADAVKQAILSDEILRRDWSRVPKHGASE